jgi:predicted dehydrogenase
VDGVRWGILGTGRMAGTMVDALEVVPNAQLIAVGSRTRDSARAFRRLYSIPRRLGSYEELVACSDVDVVYVATPHSSHAHDVALALSAGKAVLCEKAFTVNANEASHLIDLARTQHRFLMEAMWTRYVPAIGTLRDWIAAGTVGEIRHVFATLGWRRAFDPSHRLFDPALAGGALLDLGVYPISLFSMLLGVPEDVSGAMTPAPNGVDMQCAGTLAYPDGALASFAVSFAVDMPSDAMIVGSEGWIRIHAPLVIPDTLSRGVGKEPLETVHCPYLGNGYPHEVQEVMACLRHGKLESERMPLDESLAIMKTLDRLRGAWGLKYAADQD